MARMQRISLCSHKKTVPMPPEPSRSRTLYLPMLKRRHLPCIRCSAWKMVKTPSRTICPASLDGSAGRLPAARSLARYASRRLSSLTPLLRISSRNSSTEVGEAIGQPFRDHGDGGTAEDSLATAHRRDENGRSHPPNRHKGSC